MLCLVKDICYQNSKSTRSSFSNKSNKSNSIKKQRNLRSTQSHSILMNHKNHRNSNKSLLSISTSPRLLSLQGHRRSKIFETPSYFSPPPLRIIFSNRWSSCRWSSDIRQAYRPVRIFKSNYTGEAHASSIDRPRDETRERERERKDSLVSLVIDHRTAGIDRSAINRIDQSREEGGIRAKTGWNVLLQRVTRATRVGERMLALGRIIYAGYNKLPVLEISTSYGRPNGFIVVDL